MYEVKYAKDALVTCTACKGRCAIDDCVHSPIPVLLEGGNVLGDVVVICWYCQQSVNEPLAVCLSSSSNLNVITKTGTTREAKNGGVIGP